MKRLIPLLATLIACASFAADIREENYGARLPGGGEVALWCVDSGWKVGRTKPVPTNTTEAIAICAAKNEAEAAQLVVTPTKPLQAFTISAGALKSEGGAEIAAAQIEILRVGYVNVVQATDNYGATGLWPDPLPPVNTPMNLAANQNQPFWIRVTVPADVKAGKYSGAITLTAGAWRAEIPLRLEVFDFALPDKSTCETAFRFDPNKAFRYHGAKTEAEKRQVLEMYWRTYRSHHLSPYDPAPLDPIRVTWPAVKPPPLPWADWRGGLVVTNEAHGGRAAIAVFDDKRDAVVGVAREPLIQIPAGGVRLKFAYRSALPNHAFLASLQHYDENGKWISGHNNDLLLTGDGCWQTFDQEITKFPANARSFRLAFYATVWTDGGDKTGLVWFDDIEARDRATGAALTKGGDFEMPDKRELVAPRGQLEPKLDFTAWDREMERVLAKYKFNSFRLVPEGIGGGTYEGLTHGSICGFGDDTPEYEIMFGSYVKQLEQHLREKGWLNLAYVYWFDEPAPSQYDFIRGVFQRLRRHAPGLRGMLTEQVEPGLVGGPNLWCPISNEYNHQRVEERRVAGEHFWWYICCGPKGPYPTEFTDHPGTAQRAWLWQTWQRKIEGVLIWEVNYWTSPTAYPDQPQNPYEDTMSWASGGKPGTKGPWGNGDGRFLYPPETAANGRPEKFIADAPVDSIRWESFRDGIEDYEYLVTLRRLLGECGSKLDAAKRAGLTKLLEVPPKISADVKNFTHSPAPIEERRRAVARAIESLK